jgi:hypothetical protein
MRLLFCFPGRSEEFLEMRTTLSPGAFKRRAIRLERKWRLSTLCALGLSIVLAGNARADLLNPANFTSLGAFPTSPYYIDSGGEPGGPSAPEIFSSQDGSVVATGVVYNGIAVFTFDSINGSFLRPAVGARPVALLSYGDINLGSISLDTNPITGTGGPGSVVGTYTTGAVGAMGGAGGPPGNGPFYQAGQAGSYGAGSLVQNLSGGAGGAGVTPPQVQGGGGGALEVVALGNITIGSISAQGGTGGGAFGMGAGGGGGGGGGGVVIAGNSVSLTGTINVQGGTGGPGGMYGGPGGGGGGGEIDILYGSGGYSQTLTNPFNVQGGLGGQDFSTGIPGDNGANGTVNIEAVPEPSAFILFAVGGLGLLGRTLRRKATQPRA